MGELTVSVSVEIEGVNRQFQVVLKLCANLLCTKSPTDGREHFIPKIPTHKYCSDECMEKWTNKMRKDPKPARSS